MFISSAYVAKLYVHIISGTEPVMIESLDDLIADENANIYFIEGTNTVQVFKTGANRRYKEVWNKVLRGKGGLIPYTNWESIVNDDNNNYLITNKREAEHAQLRGAPLYIGKESFYDVQYAFVVRKGLPNDVTTSINETMRKFQENGIYKKMNRKYQHKLKRDAGFVTQAPYVIQALRIQPLLELIYLFLICICICMVVFVLERMYIERFWRKA